MPGVLTPGSWKYILTLREVTNNLFPRIWKKRAKIKRRKGSSSLCIQSFYLFSVLKCWKEVEWNPAYDFHVWWNSLSMNSEDSERGKNTLKHSKMRCTCHNRRRVSLGFLQSAEGRTLILVVSLRSDSGKHMVGSAEMGGMAGRKYKKAWVNWNYNS